MELTPDGTPVASTDTIVLQDFLPVPAVGEMADSGARIAAGSVQGAARLGTQNAVVGSSLPESGVTTRQALPQQVTPGSSLSLLAEAGGGLAGQ